MGKKHIFWQRRHSIARVNRRGDWIGMGSPTPVATPFPVEDAQAEPEPAAVVADEELERRERQAVELRPAVGLKRELMAAGEASRSMVDARGRGRPKKMVAAGRYK